MMQHSTLEKSCIRYVESRNRLRSAVESLRQDLKTDVHQFGDQIRQFGKNVETISRERIANKPFAAVVIAFAAGFVAGKYLNARLANPC